uniref:Uncharacterized protein n=1 Tax=Ditylenchus dipsaci TaxID=166011 RepID=A0A915DQK1_9BILA
MSGPSDASKSTPDVLQKSTSIKSPTDVGLDVDVGHFWSTTNKQHCRKRKDVDIRKQKSNIRRHCKQGVDVFLPQSLYIHGEPALNLTAGFEKLVREQIEFSKQNKEEFEKKKHLFPAFLANADVKLLGCKAEINSPHENQDARVHIFCNQAETSQ